MTVAIFFGVAVAVTVLAVGIAAWRRAPNPPDDLLDLFLWEQEITNSRTASEQRGTWR